MSNIAADLHSAAVLLLPDDGVSVYEGRRASHFKISVGSTPHVDSHLSGFPMDYTPFPTTPDFISIYEAVDTDVRGSAEDEDEDDEDLRLVCKNSFLEWTPASQLDLFRCATAPARAPAPPSQKSELVKKLAVENPRTPSTKLSVKMQENSPLDYTHPEIEQSVPKQQVQQDWRQEKPDQQWANYQWEQMQMAAAAAAASLYDNSYLYSSLMYPSASGPNGGKQITRHAPSKGLGKGGKKGQKVWQTQSVPRKQQIDHTQIEQVEEVLQRRQVEEVQKPSYLKQQQARNGGSTELVLSEALEQATGRRQQLRVASEPATDQPPVSLFVDLSVLVPKNGM
eukprot:GEMP01017962.1.p1 GENE.GEMP01017962.1~~GEMP01017962.1.p1  ORF type:complete len:360 (+),score=77.76 GEMP01017962.1:65-1081(+)